MKSILILGSGAREYAIGKKILQSPKCKKVFFAPGNGGTNFLGENIEINPLNVDEIINIVNEKKIDLVVIGPEAPLASGVADVLKNNKIQVIGPGKSGAQLETSKAFAKQFMIRNNIPTAGYYEFSNTEFEKAVKSLDNFSYPVVIKADGLAAGKGVIICKDYSEANSILDEILNKSKFGNSGNKVIIEEFLHGIEASFFILTDSLGFIELPSAKDYKRIGDGDTGLNTGGMGSVSPVPFLCDEMIDKIKTQIVIPTLDGLRNEGIEYIGFIFFGLMIVDGQPFLLEYNVRLGDPETQSILCRLKSDLVEIFDRAIEKKLSEYTPQFSDNYVVSVVCASDGYPENFSTDHLIVGYENVNQAEINFGGVINKDSKIYTSGGRVATLTAEAETLEKAIELAYNELKKICYSNIYFRKDIGKDLL